MDHMTQLRAFAIMNKCADELEQASKACGLVLVATKEAMAPELIESFAQLFYASHQGMLKAAAELGIVQMEEIDLSGAEEKAEAAAREAILKAAGK